MSGGDKRGSARRVSGRVRKALTGARALWRENGRRVTAAALVALLGFESLFSSGVSVALADAMADAGGTGQVVGQGDLQVVDGSVIYQAGDETDVAPGQGASDEGGAPDAASGAAGTETGQTPDEGAETGAAEGVDGTQTDGDAGPEEGEGTDVTAPDAGAGEDDSAPEQPVAVEPWEWTGRTENLVLSSPDGLTFAADAEPAEDGSLAATLGVSFALDPSVEGEDVGDHTVVVSGDTFSVPLPEGMTLEPDFECDVFQLDEQGNQTTVLLGAARASEDGASLVVTFSDPVDAETGTNYYVGDPAAGTVPESEAEGRERLDAISSAVELPVTVSGELLGEEPAQIEWLLQTSSEDPSVTQTATLELPAAPVVEGGTEGGDAVAGEGEPVEEPVAAPVLLNALAPYAQTNTLSSPREAETEVSYATSGSTSATMDVTWCDNNSDDRPDRSTWVKNVIPEFSLDDGETWIPLLDEDGAVTQAARDALGMGAGQTPVWAQWPTSTAMSVGDWRISSSGLPDELTVTTRTPTGEFDEHGQPTYDVETETTHIKWRLRDTNETPTGYVTGINDGGATGSQRYFMRTQTYTFTIVGNLGGHDIEEVFGKNFSDDRFAAGFTLSASINNQPVEGSASLQQIQSNPRNGCTITMEGNTATVTATLPMYNTAGYPIVYHISYDQPATEGDHFQASYNNAASPSHGSATDALYDGGTMTLRPVGTTSYGATKAWLDGGDESSRGEVTFTLWRYSTAPGASATTAAQVQLNAIDDSGVATNSVEYVSITVPKGSGDEVDLGELLRDHYGAAIDSLAKYDPDGYPYIYALREDTNLAGYSTVYGSVAPEGSENEGEVTDTAPSYVDVNGDKVTLEQVDRTSDPLIYNGGTITNRREGNVTVKGTKTWQIAAFQDALADVEVTFSVQVRKKADGGSGSASAAAWEDTGVTETVTGWRAETLTRSFSKALPLYDDWGNELEYRWVESGVKLGDQETNFQQDEDGGGTFQLTLTNAEGGDETLDFTSSTSVDPDTGESLVTNTFVNITDEHVDKYWQQPDGSMEQSKPPADGYPDYPDLDLSGRATVRIFRNGEQYAEFTMDGTADDAPTFIEDDLTDPESDPYAQETSAYHVDFENLPKYDENGVRYTYLVLEDGVGGWHSTRTYDSETRTTVIENAVGTGGGSEIRVMKDWVDGADDAHRLDVVVQLVALEPMENVATGETYGVGDVVDVSAIENTDGTNWIDPKTDEITLSADNAWFVEAYVPVNRVYYDDFELVEVALVDNDGTRYPVTTRSDAGEAYEDIDIPKEWINVGWDYSSTEGTSRVATKDHVYQVYATKDGKGEYNEDMRAVTASNRRLGLLDLTVEKTWNDGVDHERPQAELVVKCLDENSVFHIQEGTGIVWVQLAGGNPVPVMNGSGEDARPLIANVDDVRIENGDLVVTVDTSLDQETYHFYGLPKYDGDGQVVHYDVEERWVDEPGEYTSSKGVGEYTIGDQHFHDTQTYSFTNTRSAKRDVTFYKNWHDQYVNDELGQRPDIYLTLYRVTVSRGEDGGAVYSEPQAVDGYVNYVWHGKTVDDNPQYNQACTIGGLDAYDTKGNAYIYYAQESMSVDDGGASLDYAPVTFDCSTVSMSNGEKTALWVGEGAESGSPEEDARGWAIHEGGTFVNSLTSNLVARGFKLWENVPGNVDQDDLPKLTVYLQRKTADEEWPELTFTKVTDSSGNVTWVPGRDQAVAWTSDLREVTTNQYSYLIGYAGENTLDESGDLENNGEGELPRYDEDGQIYEYRAIEVPWGLYGKPGGFDDADLGLTGGVTSDLTSQDTAAGDLGVYVIEHGETGSFMIRNRYSSETGNLTVEKHFTGREAGDFYPTTTFEVYRYYVNEDGERSDEALVGSVTLTNAQLSGDGDENLEVTGTDSNNAIVQYTFTGLDVYAPDGSYWQYYVTERGINGYTATVEVGGVPETVESGEDLTSPDLCPTSGGTASTVTGTVIEKDQDADVTFTNAYVPDSTTLSGTKTWEDYVNAFGTRPTADEFAETLTLSRYSSSMPIETLEFGKGESDPYHLTVIDEADGSYSIKIENVEKWAPDGTAWRYTLAEGSLDGSTGYTELVSSSTVSASSGQSLSLKNGLEGQATVTKEWVDGGDPYGLRPTTVTVTLQARLTPRTSGAAANAGKWDEAYDALASVMSDEQKKVLASSGFSGGMDKTLSADTGWKASWTGLPLVVLGGDNTLYDVEYRAIETKIGDQPVTMTDDGTYELCASYQPSQTEGTGLSEGRWSTDITNTLTGVSISASKTWDDNDNVWGTRPGGDEWVVRYYLQRRLKDAAGGGSATADGWQWVVEYGTTAPADDPLDEGVVSQTLTASDSNHTWENLPRYDANGEEYEYRVVEEVPGSYDVDGGTEVTTAVSDGVTYRYYVVGSGTTSDQDFENDLRTTSLTGTKAWDDASDEPHEGPNEDGSNAPEMTLYRAYKTTGEAYSDPEDVTGYAGQPTWSDGNDDGTWEFEYTGLPAANEDNVDYVYWAVESDSVDGYYPLYGSDRDATSPGAAGTTVTTPADASTDGVQTNEAITNVATRLSLAKVSDWKGDAQLTNITLSVQSADGSKTYAVWTNGADGATYETYTWVNGTENPDDKDGAAHRTDNLIVGLHTGTYKVVETGTVPEGYAKAPEVSFTINENGKASTASGVSTSTEDGVNTITVTATDPVLRGHLQLTKYVSADGTDEGRRALAGATFDLYRKDMDGDGEDELIASDLTTNEDGVVTTVGNTTSITAKSSNGTVDLTYGGKYTTLSDGLPEGKYYFLETDATSDAVTPSGDGARSDTLTITQDDHYAYTKAPVGATMVNVEFTAQVTLHKYDSSTGAGIDGAVFSVSYVPEDGGASQSLPDVTTSDGGKLVLSDLKKGTYTVTEKSNTGYDVSDPFSATFTISNEDHDQSFDITSADCQDATDVSFTVSKGTYTTSGVPNTPLRGTVSMTKTGMGDFALDGATFELQRKRADGSWVAVAEGLVTGKSYAMDDANSALAGDPGEATAGTITVSNLTWGTYRFAETEPAPGYVGVANGQQVKSAEVTVGRDNVPGTVSAGTVVNEPTRLEINKRNEVGHALNGAVFTVTPAQGSSFADGSTDPIKLTTEDTGHAELDGQLVVGDTYEIYEAQGPTGYDPADGTLTIRVAEDGSIELVGTMPGFYEIKGIDTTDEYPGLDDGAVIVTNVHEAISLVKVSAETGAALEGAEFTLTGQCMDGRSEHTYVTDENGAIAIDAGLQGSVLYQLRETSAPDGYVEMGEALYFYMDDRGEIDPVDAGGDQIGELPEGWSVGGDNISLTARDNPVELQITKVDPEGRGLPGAAFTIAPADGSRFADGGADPIVRSTGEDGTLRVTAELVVGGSYDITETSAPEGYERVTGTMRVTVGTDGSINVEGSVEDGLLVGSLAPTGYAKAGDSAFEVRVTNEPIKIGLVKVDAGDSGTRLGGAEFEVTGVFAGSTARETRSYVTDDQGRIDLDAELRSGETYTLVETVAPAGYELIAGELSFSVDERGEVSVEGAAPAGYGVEQGNVTIVASDQPLLVSLVKYGEDGAPLSGATFTVAPAEGAFPDGDAAKEFTSGPDGTVFEGLMVAGSAEGTRYTVTETVPAVGYEALPAFDVLVFEDGTVRLAEGAPEAVRAALTLRDEGGTAVMGLTDELIEASLKKVSDGGEALSGAEFELTGTFADGGTPRTVTVGEGGTASLEGLVAGETYTLRETRAPEGYELIEGTWSFSVEADGTLAPAEGHEPAAEGEAGYRVVDGVTLVATDRRRGTGPGAGLSATGDTTRQAVPVAVAAGGVAMLAAALAIRRRSRREGR